MRRILFTLLLTSCASADTNAPDPHTTVTVEPPAPATPATPTEVAPLASAPDVGVVAPDLEDRIARFQPVAIPVDDGQLDARQKAMLRKLIEAGQLVGQIALRQVDAQNVTLRSRLASDAKLKTALAYFDMMLGPWDRTDPHE